MTPSPRPAARAWVDRAADDGVSQSVGADVAIGPPFADDNQVELVNATEYATEPGIPGRGVILISLLASGVCVGLDFALTGGLTMFFDLCFIVVCLIGAMAVHPRDLFTTGVLAPLAFGAIIGAVAILSPTTFSAVGGFGKVFPTGLTAHAGALVTGYGVALATVASRVSASRAR